MKERHPTQPNPAPVVRLEYFAASVPRDSVSRQTLFAWMLLGLGWIPFTCGVVSSQAVAQSGAAETVRVHHQAGASFMAIGMLLTLVCIVAFLIANHRAHAFLAAFVLILQICVFLCVGAV